MVSTSAGGAWTGFRVCVGGAPVLGARMRREESSAEAGIRRDGPGTCGGDGPGRPGLHPTAWNRGPAYRRGGGGLRGTAARPSQ